MGSGAQLAQERDGWAADWREADLDQEGEHLLGLLDRAEELRAAVPAVRVSQTGDTAHNGGDGAGGAARPSVVLIGVTDRRIIVVGRWNHREIDVVTSATAYFEQGRDGDWGRLELRDDDAVLELDLVAQDRLRDLLDGQGVTPAPLSGGLSGVGEIAISGEPAAGG